MHTVMFIERHENQGKGIIDFQYNRYNYHYAPNGIIRIARFKNVFIVKNDGYYSDGYYSDGYYSEIYMKWFIRKWKRKTYENIQRKKDRINAKLVLNRLGIIDVDNIIMEFL